MAIVALTFLILLPKVCVLDIDVQGVKAVKASFLRAKYVFIAPPSIEVTRNRYDQPGIYMTKFPPLMAPTYSKVLIAIISNHPDAKVLEKRLRDRSTETEESLSRRLNNSREEMEYGNAEVHGISHPLLLIKSTNALYYVLS